MNNIFFLVFRRMRTPLLVLIGVYAIAILGMVLIPGQDADGAPWQMDFLHAFYFVSYMATTIGFGEIPYALTPAQRLWVTLCIYLTVIAWLYAIGKILTLLQDPALEGRLREGAMAKAQAYEIGNVTGQLIDIYHQAVADKKAGRYVAADRRRPIFQVAWEKLFEKS